MNLQTRERDEGAQKIRIPLDHPETELVAKRIRGLITSGKLTDSEWGRLIKKERELCKADRFLARVLYGHPLVTTNLRPLFWNYAGPHAHAG